MLVRISEKAAHELTINQAHEGDDDGVRQTLGGRKQQDAIMGARCDAGASTRRRIELALPPSRFYGTWRQRLRFNVRTLLEHSVPTHPSRAVGTFQHLMNKLLEHLFQQL